MLDECTFLSQLNKFVGLKTYPRDVEVNKKALDYLQSLIHPNAQITRTQNLDTEILIASNCSGFAPEIGFLVHMDVVSGQNNQFNLKIEGRRAVGRGASDMKFALPIGVALLNELIEKNVSVPFAFIVTTDEEKGGTQGAQYVADNLQLCPKILIVPDGGDNYVFVVLVPNDNVLSYNQIEMSYQR